jgi:hypothetical protein
MSRRLHAAAEDGYTLAAIMLVMLATSIMAGAAFAAVGADLPFTRAAQDRKQAYAAAEAGIEFYLYQLTRDNDFWKNCADVPPSSSGEVSPVNLQNPVNRRWRRLSGSTDARFSIELLPANGKANCAKATASLPTQPEDTMIDMATGTFRIRATGESRGIRRSIIATFRRNGFLDYLYFTDYEASDPLSFASVSDQNEAKKCVLYRAQRNLSEWCRDNVNITFPKWDVINGPLHTNDDLLTCGSPDFGRAGKGDRIQIVGPAPNGWTGSTSSGCGGSPDFFGPKVHPAKYLPVPTSNSRLKEAALPGYLFLGRTEIRFDGSNTMSVSVKGATAYPLPLPPNGVIYVEKDGTCTLTAPRAATYPPGNGCGVLTVEGIYPKSMTLGARDDIIIDGDLKKTGDVVLGLIAQRFVRVMHPVDDCENDTGTMTNISIEAAILALNDSFIVDNYGCGNAMGTLTVTGAIAQKFRGPVGTFNTSTGNKVTGYSKNYNYDDRLRYRNPPYFLDPVSAAWRVVRQNEQVPAPTL